VSRVRAQIADVLAKLLVIEMENSAMSSLSLADFKKFLSKKGLAGRWPDQQLAAALGGVVDGYVVAQDSSADNVRDDRHGQPSGTIAAPGRVLIEAATFDKNWHDKDESGRPYDHFGIVVSGPA
jgi:hypothetical protein